MRILGLLLLSLFTIGCSSKKIKDISYLDKVGEKMIPKLNVFMPKTNQEKLPVLIFVHGGNWNTGNKNIYSFLGRNFAKKNVVTVIPGYTLSPNASYYEMALQIAEVIKWTKANIEKFHGDPNKIFVTGHSAGGHLVALAVMNPKYGIDQESIRGIILNDAAGLDMKHYLEENPPTSESDYDVTWTKNPAKWRDASPIYFINKQTPPILIYIGAKTYESIKIGNDRFIEKLLPFQKDLKIIQVNKSHIPMILQYFCSGSKRYDETLHFMKNNIN